MKKAHSRVRGTSDFYPPHSYLFYNLTQKARKVFKIFGYEEVILPILEEKGLFEKSIGESSDIVERQMFKIEGKNIVLRPEGTAGVIRFYIEHGLSKKGDFWKFFYIGPMFRGERPQRGRLRQFHHIGAEAMGTDSFYLDAEIVQLAISIIKEIGISQIFLEINSLGCPQDKERLSKRLQKMLVSDREKMCPNCQRRLMINPLRVLDCKQAECQRIVSSLELKDEHLCSECKEKFFSMLSLLDEVGIEYRYNSYLVRGIDYYTNTVFEIKSPLLGAQDAIGAGGRYNGLVARLGGENVPCVGFALGIERILLLLPQQEGYSRADVFVAYSRVSVYKKAYHILNQLRENGISSEIDYKNRSLKAQLKYSQKIGALFAIIVGEEEITQECVQVRNMKESFQTKVSLSELVPFLKNALIKMKKGCAEEEKKEGRKDVEDTYLW